MELSPELLLLAYENGYFPMAQSRRDTELYWFSPDPRAVIPLDTPHIPRRLKRSVRQQPYQVSVDAAFYRVITACAQPRANDGDSWINATLINLYTSLHELGHAHSIECWDPDGHLAGGLYGVSSGGAFFGESMVSLQRDASKIAFVYLLEILRQCGFALLDSQFTNRHLEQFGIVEIPREDYLERLESALICSPSPSRQFSRISRSVVSSDPASFSVIAPVSASGSSR